MSKQSAEEFFKKLADDEALAGKVRDASKIKEVLDASQAAGYMFTKDEYLAVHAEVFGPASKELDDSDLDSVTGGTGSFRTGSASRMSIDTNLRSRITKTLGRVSASECDCF